MTIISEQTLARILAQEGYEVDDYTAGVITARARAVIVEYENDDDWQAYRRAHLTPNGWRLDSPGCYVHQETGNQFHPFDSEPGTARAQWRVRAEEGRAPDPERSHIDRRFARPVVAQPPVIEKTAQGYALCSADGELLAPLALVALRQHILCPECECAQVAFVTQEPGHFWPSFVHECAFCGYIILESEWDVIEEDTDGHDD